MKYLKINNRDKGNLVDDEDYDRLLEFNWRAYNGEVMARSELVNGVKLYISLASEVMGKLFGLFDHKDRDTYNNQKINLRPCDKSQNQVNRRKRKLTNSIYRGVEKADSVDRWKARIAFRRVKYCLGTYATQEEAAKAYDTKAKELHGEFAQLNFP